MAQQTIVAGLQIGLTGLLYVAAVILTTNSYADGYLDKATLESKTDVPD